MSRMKRLPKQLLLYFLVKLRICGDLLAKSKTTHARLKFPMESIFTHPNRTGLRDQQRCNTRRR